LTSPRNARAAKTAAIAETVAIRAAAAEGAVDIRAAVAAGRGPTELGGQAFTFHFLYFT